MKQMMEKLGAPQTHVGLKAMIAEIDEDNDGKVSFREVSAAHHYFFLEISIRFLRIFETSITSTVVFEESLISLLTLYNVHSLLGTNLQGNM